MLSTDSIPMSDQHIVTKSSINMSVNIIEG